MRRMRRFVILISATVTSPLCGHAYGLDYQIHPDTAHVSQFRMPYALTAPLGTPAVSADQVRAAVPPEYASAMTWYRVALTSGARLPLVGAEATYGEMLPESLQWTWSAGNGDLVTRVGKGSFRLTFQDSRNNWFREVNCRLVRWPGGDALAVMTCEDGMRRTMQIREQGVVIGNVLFERAFRKAPLNFDDASPQDEALPLRGSLPWHDNE
jgi:hypothetical protein